MTLLKYNRPSTGRGMTPVFNQLFNEIFDNFNSPSIRSSATPVLPPVNVAESDSHFLMELSAPGFSKEEINISLEENTLTIAGQKQSENEEQGKRFNRREFSFQNFQRSFTLPEDIEQEKIEGKFENGILKLTIPKKQTESKTPRKIELI